MAKDKSAALTDRWNAEEELLADIDRFRTDYLHNGASQQQLLQDVEVIDRLKGRLERKLLKRVTRGLQKLAKNSDGPRDEAEFRDMIHNVLMEEVETYRKLHS